MPRSPWLPVCLIASAVLSTHCSRTSADSTSQEGSLPVLGTVPAFSVVDQTGAPVSPQSLQGRPFVAAFMFTRCPSICPRITARMRELQQAAAANKVSLRLVSISVDPEFDTPEVLRAYAAKNAIDTATWSLWTGPYETIAQAAEHGFKIGLSGKADTSKADLGITHGSHLILVDKESRIRGYYRTFDDDVVPRLLADLPRL